METVLITGCSSGYGLATARRFIAGFPGLVTYAVKSNPDEAVIANLRRDPRITWLDAADDRLIDTALAACAAAAR